MGFLNDSYDINVGTQPMADKLNVVAHKVDLTTGAVAGMETAVIAQEKASTEEICGKLDVGFFNVVMSQIAQKMANESAKTHALAMELLQQQKALQNLQLRMTGDYNMISSRYAKLFGSLNQELKNRVTELDKPIMEFCLQNIAKLQNRILNLVSGVPVLQSEGMATSQSIAAAHLKSNAQELISAVSNYVKSDMIQKNTTETLWDGSNKEEEVYYVPFIIKEDNIERGNYQIVENEVLRVELPPAVYPNILKVVNSKIDSLEWRHSSEKLEKVIRNFQKIMDESALPSRIKEVILRLFNDNFQTL